MSTGTPTLPGSIPGLLRRGSPVVCAGCDAVVVDTNGGGEPYVVAGYFRGTHEMREWERGTDLALDLSDATGRAHAAWWLAEDPAGEPDSMPPWARGFVRPFSWAPVGSSGSTLAGWDPDGQRIDKPSPGRPEWVSGSARGVCDALDSLDPEDPRTLPDGSRWVDAEALRRVCLHVAGLEDRCHGRQ